MDACVVVVEIVVNEVATVTVFVVVTVSVSAAAASWTPAWSL